MEAALPRPAYPADLSDAAWAIREPLVPTPLPGGRPPRHARREIVNAILSVRRTGCHWRALPPDLPPWGTVWWSVRRWREAGVWEQINTARREQRRLRLGRQPTPRAAILDSQSAMTTEPGGRGASPGASRAPAARGMASSRPGAWS